MTFLIKAGSVVLLLVGLLTWLLAHSLEPADPRLAEMKRNLDMLAVGDPILHRDILSARAGVLRTYDPIVRDVDNMRNALVRLQRIDGAPVGPLRTIEHAWEREEQLVEQFKTGNALLENSIMAVLRTSPHRFDVAIAEKALDGMGGLDFARTLRAGRVRLPVILSVPLGDPIEAERLRAAGVADILRRPWRSGSVAATLARNLRTG